MNYKVDKLEINEKITKNNLVVVLFYVDWCGECKMMHSVFDAIFKDIIIKKEVVFCKINVDEEQMWDGNEHAGNFKILKVPTVIFFKNNKEIKRNISFMPREDLKNDIKTLIKD